MMRILALQTFGFANQVVQQLDLIRIALLRMTLSLPTLRHIYRDRALRLGVNFVLLSVVYFVISLRWSDFLLVLGPLLLGYPHLIASYRFLHSHRNSQSAAKIFQFFIGLTVVALVVRHVAVPNKILPQLPYGVWEIVISLVALPIVCAKPFSLRRIFALAFAFAMIAGVVRIAWNDPIAFVGYALLVHNWVGFAHWISSAKDRPTRGTAVLATLMFAVVHACVFMGMADQWISIPTTSIFSMESFDAKGWILAPWSNEVVVWNRVVVLYTFGLSMHYFVWLQAIPQSTDVKQAPNSFRESWRKLLSDCGGKVTYVLLAGGVLAFGMWFFTPYAGRIYFGVAMLHGWLELTFIAFSASLAAISLVLRNPRN